MLSVDPPQVTDWMQAWGSVAGILMSTLAVIFTGLLFRHEIRVRRETQQDGEAAQARLVVATFTTLAHAYPERGFTTAGYRIDNFSVGPVFDVRVRHVRKGVPMTRATRIRLVRKDSEDYLPLLNPLTSDVSGSIARELDVEIVFTDANGLRWRRVGSDAPQRAVPPVEETLSRKKIIVLQVVFLVVGILLGLGVVLVE